ncbi:MULTISPECIES: polysaccharide lyase family 1 protein [unclassified Uliginosibacterium]|uniref:pectate lyase family protein n=1 Tax=unclassified Uliginosibacterium TaxID=2621521 RepID=UPI000C7B3BEE|nr:MULTISPECIES: PbsX family transcriptional regulator [unclassified Uliginosibacterium]MDO6388414.1 PbsX family transcriptional regulator [Uliginosibacterium sp. 31-12]PLK47289.1 PbsX family transcriptional regulator [Uliginosibacterium sp. TH139]
MKKNILALSVAMIGVLSGCAGFELEAEGDASGIAGSDLGRAVMPANNGWAAAEGAVTGGSAATAENDFTVSSRKELVAALAKAGTSPKIIRIQGTINLSSDDSGRELTEKDYAVAPYNFDAYMKAYAPAVWNQKLEKGRPNRKLDGPQEAAREASVKRQRDQITIKLPSNTTLVGLGADAKIVKGNLWIGPESENVIIRNISFEDAFDYFPGWDPGDSFKIDKSYPGCQEAYVDAKTGPQLCPGGRWNSEYDNISVNGGKRVWIDHCTFSDGDRSDKLFPPIFPFPHNEVTQKVQHHDGLVDVTNGGNYVTISYSVFKDHDKSFLIGGSDSSKLDTGKLNVTIHNNYFENVGQRAPRVRFGKVHVYNNYYVANSTGLGNAKTDYEKHQQELAAHAKHNIARGLIGVGKDSAIYSEANVFEITGGKADIAVMPYTGGTVFFDQGSSFNGQPVDLLAESNAASGKALSPNVGWKPTLYGSQLKPAAEVPAYVKANAGAGKL